MFEESDRSLDPQMLSARDPKCSFVSEVQLKSHLLMYSTTNHLRAAGRAHVDAAEAFAAAQPPLASAWAAEAAPLGDLREPSSLEPALTGPV
jgi:hypothetical protein